jgi:hypothetical protein
MNNTITLQGQFTSTGANIIIPIPSGVSWMRVLNQTALTQAAAVLGYDFFWQVGMPISQGVVWTKNGGLANNSVTVGELAANNGFTVINTSIATPGVSYAITGFSAANPPVVLTATTPLVGQFVRLANLNNQPQFAGIDFQVTAVNPGVSFTLGGVNAVGTVVSNAGSYRVIPVSQWYPTHRAITYMSAEVTPVIYTSVSSGYQVGQEIRLNFPGGTQVWGNYALLDGMQTTILAVGNAPVIVTGNEPTTLFTITVNIDTSAYGPWAFAGPTYYPPAALVPFSPAQTTPIGEYTSIALLNNVNILSDATLNTAFIGMQLGGGLRGAGAQNAGPAGGFNTGTGIGDSMFWMAGNTFTFY